MKRIIYITFILASLLLTSCRNNCRESVAEKYPNAEIYTVNRSYEFIVIDSTGVYYVLCNNPFSSNIMKERLIKKF